MAHIYAPFTDEQVEKLKAWQSGEKTFPTEIGEGGPNPTTIHVPPHPFTSGLEDCDRLKQPDEGALIHSTEGWTCPCGKYKQNWCNDFMVE
jgi:hypothetical protein